MHSSEERGSVASSDEPRKLSFKRIERALDQILTIALPLHIQSLNEKREKIEELKKKNSLAGLHYEHVEANKYVRLLQADLFELEQLNSLVEDKDKDLFSDKIKGPIKEAIESLSRFMELHPDALEPLPDLTITPEFPELVCNLDQESFDVAAEAQSLPIEPIQLTLTSKSSFIDWSFLRKELLDIHTLISKFSSLVFTQKEKVDTIQNNVEQTHENVKEGVYHLRKASLLKAASFPIAGAIVGGVLMGPIGALAGFKLLGIAASVAGGGALGYKAGTTIKKKHESSCDIEMKALTYPSKEKSASNPELNAS